MKVLRPYQRDALAYAIREKDPALFMQMRLGKTLVVIRRCRMYRPRGERLRVLVFAPGSALPSWADELTDEGQAFVWLTGSKARRQRLLRESADVSWILVNTEAHRTLPELARMSWDAVVLDESPSIKNAKAGVTKFFLRSFRDARHRWILAGRPAPESDLEYWSQIAWLNGGEAFGYRSFWAYRSEQAEPEGFKWTLKRESLATLREYIGRRCFVLSRKQAGVDVEKVPERRVIPLSDEAKRLYRTVEEDFVLELRDAPPRSTIFATQKYIWLRRLCGGFVDGRLVWDGKLRELRELVLGELVEEPVVVWCRFNEEVYGIRDYLRDAVSVVAMTGDEDMEERARLVQAFNAGRIRVLVVQVAVAATGANLSHASTAIYYSEPEGLLAREQSEDRILRVGGGLLLYIYLQAADTLDTDLHATLAGKRLRSGMSMGDVSKKLLERVRERTQ